MKRQVDWLVNEHHSDVDHLEDSKHWAGRVAMQWSALHKAGDMFQTIGRNMAVPDDMRALAMAGRDACDKAMVDAGWPTPERAEPRS